MINPQNYDLYCFMWRVIIALYYEETGNNSKLRKYVHMYNLDGLEFPVSPKDKIQKEQQHPSQHLWSKGQGDIRNQE